MARGKKPKIDVSRGKFKCKVPSCQTELRSDHVKEHYEKRVLFDKMNRIEEIEESGKFSALELQTHTSYFKEMGWINESMIPSYKSHEIAMSKGSQSIDRFFVKPPSSVNEDSNGDVEAREDGNEVVSKTTADWLAELELSKVKKAGSFLDGCKVFLSGFSEPEQMQLARVLEYSGGVRLTKLVESVTHCVHSVGTNTVVPDTSKLLEQLDLSPHMVSIQWMVESMLLGKPVQEADFPFPPQLEAEKETILPPQDTQLQASYEQKTAEADQSHFMANLLAGGVGYSGFVSLNPAAEYDDEPDINQNILRTKRRIGEVDSSSEDEEEDEPEAFALENMDVEVTPPSSHNSSFQEDSQGAPFLKEVADASIANLEATEGGNLLNPDNVGQVVKRELLNALSGVGEYKEIGAIHRFDLDEADIQRAFGMLEELVDSFPACDRDAFDIRAALPGFIHWDKYQSQHRLNSKGKIISIEENWVDFVKLSNTEGRNEFKKLFEYCMVDVMSEAMAENVGSVMTHHLGSGSRNTLLPVNLNCEISIRCNLGPLHMLESVVKSVVMRRIDEDQVLYKRALDGKRPYMLKALVNTSSSIHTYREEEKKKAHLPLSIW